MRLVAGQLVKAATEPSGPRRNRTVHTITAKGRREFTRWLGTAPTPPSFGSEILLRITFADAADEQALLGAIASCRTAVENQYSTGKQQVTEHLQGVAPYPERASLNTIWWVLIGEQLRLTIAWLDWAEAEVRTWGGTHPHGLDHRLRALAERIVSGQPVLLHG